MEILYFTLAAVLLYLFSDWALRKIESLRGEPFENRSVVFFVIILVLSLGLFNLIQKLQPVPESTSDTSATSESR